ncbi:hypothetical protein TorRG33x02_065980 [Trema orientale]|uniref:Uncharacterized protein n=1 Tax=Trema orientale TaxID=63057 RepID=A0A2P5FIR3_TREOI|nr:hypothetical protein TorRG33x02_065980 [Trema orientale]
MPIAESVKPSGSSSEGDHHQKHKQLDRDVREMVSAITSRLTNIHKTSSGHGLDQSDQNDDGDDEKGVRIITLAGTNTGATLRGELDDKPAGLNSGEPVLLGDSEALRTYVNSNFQAVNNSIMMGGSYSTNDPGVHVEISDFIESQESKPEYRRGWKGKKKSKDALKSDHKSSSSD